MWVIRGVWFTWERRNLSKANIREILDRRVANMDWMNLFPSAVIQHLPHSFFDHCRLPIWTNQGSNLFLNMKFHFEAWWEVDEFFKVEVKRVWSSTSGNLLHKVDVLKSRLTSWAQSIKKNREGLKKALSSKLVILMKKERDMRTLLNSLTQRSNWILKLRRMKYIGSRGLGPIG